MAAIRTLCTRGNCPFARGNSAYSGNAENCIREYEKTISTSSCQAVGSGPSPSHPPRLASLKSRCCCGGAQPDIQLCIESTISGGWRQMFAPFFSFFDILDSLGTPIMQAYPTLDGVLVPGNSQSRFRLTVDLPPLVPGTYSVTAWFGAHNTQTLDFVRNCVSFTVHDSPVPGRTFPHTADHGFLVPRSAISII